uniref:BZIP domain-containing protein n=1 Tax=Globodera pallida TaxID=36090 RepID=A0A183BJC7_GLOPA
MDAPPPPPPTAELFELAPPMDPPANNFPYDAHHLHLLGTPKARPGSLISAGLAAITANYGGFGHQNEGDGRLHEQAFRLVQPSPPPVDSAHPLVMAPLMAAAFRRPAVVHHPSPLVPTAPALYPNVYASEPAPSAFFPTPGVTPTYGGCLSLDPIGMAFAWNFFGTSDVIGYELNTSSSSDSPSTENPQLLHSLYPLTPSAPPPSVQLSSLVAAPSSQSYDIDSPNFVAANSPQTSNSPPTSKPTSTSALAMPRGANSAKAAQRRGGRRPREAEQHEQQLTDEDKDRRAKRRERNKQAAARCRRRREEKMQSLQEQVDELRKQNERRESEIRKMREKEHRLLEMLRLRSGGIVQQQLHHHLQAVHVQQQQHPSTDHLAQASRPAALLQPFLMGMNNRRRVSFDAPMPSSSSSAASSSKKEESDVNSSTDESPDGAHHFPLGGPLVNGTDPVISVSALSQQSQPVSFELSTSVAASKRPKFEPFDMSNNRPTSLQLNSLYREGFVAGTPSKELAQFGVNGTEVELTPVNELTPGLSQLTQLTEHPTFGVLMAQETGLTPCQHGPVLIQHGGERPANGELNELR